MDTKIETWNAFQIGMSNGAYSGRTVTFTDETGMRRTGTLNRSDHSTGETTPLVVDGSYYAVPNLTLVEVN